MLSRIPHWRQRLIDLAVVLVFLIFVGHVWPKIPLGTGATLSALVIWGTGLAAMGHYKAGAMPGLAGSAGKLLIDHAILSAIWFGALFVIGPKPEVTFILIFGVMSFAGLAIGRLRALSLRWLTSLDGSWIAADIVFGVTVFFAVNGLRWNLAFPFSLLGAIIVGRTLAQGVTRWIAPPLLAWLAGQALFAVAVLGLRPVFHWSQSPTQLALGASVLPAVVIGAYRLIHRLGGPADRREIWRQLVLVAGVFALLHPLFCGQLMGAWDAKLYAEAMQDFLGQIKAGIFPVFVSQTEIAPWGSVFPFRMAFYHFHFGALLDLLTWHSLNVYAVQHLTLILSGFGGALGLYAVLKKLAPARAWDCAALALLYLGCPAWLSAYYGLDMYFTVMTLPWLPLVIYGTMRLFQPECGWRTYLLLGVALAATWLAHPPVGFWTAVVVTMSQLLRLATGGQRPSWRDLGGLALAAGVCLLLCAGLFVSLADARIPGELVDPSTQVIASLRSVVPRVFQPVSAAAERLSDMQLGYACQLLLLAGVMFRPYDGRRAHAILLGLAAGLCVLIYPVPGITAPLWRALPWEVTNITNVWPMQRLYPLLATLAAFIALGAVRTMPTSRRATAWRLAAFVTMLFWTGLEAEKFLRRGRVYTKSLEATRVISEIENSPLLSSWTAYTPHLPPYTLEGRVNDPRLLNRLLDPTAKIELASNARAAGGPATTAPMIVNATHLDRGVLQLTPGFTLEPEVRYQLTFFFTDANYAGVLQLLPLHDIHLRFYREIPLPSKPSSPLTLTVWTTEKAPLPVDMLLRTTDAANAEGAHPAFLRYQLVPYRAAELPIKITSLAPYRASVETAQPALLETHRFFARGYRALVNGHAVPVTESPGHLAMLPLDSGRNEVRLDYVGPPLVRAAFWVSAFSWIAVAGLAAWMFRQSWLARRANPVHST